MQTVFLALEAYNHYSDVLRGRLIRVLAEKYRVVVLTKDIDEITARKMGYYTHRHITYHTLTVAYPRLWNVMDLYIRKYFVRSHDDLFLTQHWYYGFLYSRLDRMLNIIGNLLPKKIFTSHFFTSFEMTVTRPTKEFREIASRYQPALLIVPTPGYGYMSLVPEVILFARKMNIPSIAINCTYDQPFSQAKFLRKTDFLCVWSERMKKDAANVLGYGLRELFVVGGPLKFDHYVNDIREDTVLNRDEFLQSKGLNPRKKTILYATPSPGVYKQRLEILEALVRLKRERGLVGDPNILVRIHPFDEMEPYEQFMNLPGISIELAGRSRMKGGGARGIKIEMEEDDLRNMTDSLRHADVVLNFASSMTVEASLFDKPIVNVAFRDRHRAFYEYESNRPIRHRGVARFAENVQEMKSCLNVYLEHPEYEYKKRIWLRQEYVPFCDGKIYQRTADVIEDILQQNI